MTVLAVLRGTLVLTAALRPRRRGPRSASPSCGRRPASWCWRCCRSAGLSWVAVTEARSAMTRQVEERMSVTAAVSADYVEQQADVVQTVVAAYANRRLLTDALRARRAGPGGAGRPDRGAASPRTRGSCAAWILDVRGA
jgi:hypothetical protein